MLHAVPHLDRVGGCERQALLLARHQAQQASGAGSVQPLVLTHAVPTREVPADVTAARDLPARQEQDAAPPPDSPDDNPGEPAVWRLERGLRRYHPGAWWRNHGRGVSIVHAHAVHKLCGQVVALAARDGVPSLVKVATPADVELFAEPARWRELIEPEDDPAHYGPRWRWTAALTWRRLRLASAFLALNDDIAASLAAHGLHVERLRNAVDCGRFAPAGPARREAARAALGLHPGTPCVASVGRLVARKDVGVVLRALAALPALPAQRAPATLLVCGDGPHAPELRRIARELGVNGRVRWLGQSADVRAALHAADAFVHASRSEGFPNALLEALACGLPAVLSDIAGHRDGEVLPGDAALMFPPGDDAALAAALTRLLEDPAACAARGSAARETALRHYALPVVASQLEQLYAQLVAEGRQAAARRGAPGARN